MAGVVVRPDPPEISSPLLLEWIVAIAIVDMLPVPRPVGFVFSLSFPLQLRVAEAVDS